MPDPARHAREPAAAHAQHDAVAEAAPERADAVGDGGAPEEDADERQPQGSAQDDGQPVARLDVFSQAFDDVAGDVVAARLA